MSHYPIFIDLRGRRAVVIGGGPLALEKVEGLLAAQAEVTLIAAEAIPELGAVAEIGRVTWERRGYRDGDLASAWIAIDAGGDDEVSVRVREEADRERVMLNVVDRTRLCHWIAPAIVRRGPLQIAISTAGESPFLASSLRARLERSLGVEWGPFTQLMGTVRRRLRARAVPLPRQTRIYRRLLRSEARELIRRNRLEEARATAAGLETAALRGRVTLVGAGPGDPGLLTLAAVDSLAEADVVFHDALVDPRVLEFCGPHTRLVDVGKRGGSPGATQEQIEALLLEAAGGGLDAVRLKGGDPFVFGRGGEELQALVEAGIQTRVIPGVTSAVAAPALAGIPLTLRGVAASFAVTTGRTAAGPDPGLERLAASVDTLVVLMALSGLRRTAARLAAVAGAERPAAVVSRAGSSEQRTVIGTLGDIAALAEREHLSAPATLITGEVVAFAATLAAARSHSAEQSG